MAIRREDLEAGRIDLSDVIEESEPDAAPIHPGEVLRMEFLEPLGMSVYALAAALHLPRPRLNDIALGRRAISADTALRLARYFGTSPQIWVNLQTRYDLAKPKLKQRPKPRRKPKPRRES